MAVGGTASLQSAVGRRFQECCDHSQLRALAELVLKEWFDSERQRVLLWNEVSDPKGWLANPVLAYFERVQCAVVEAHVVDSATWKTLCPRADHSHVLMGPVVLRGDLIGALAATRGPERPFLQDDLNRMNHLALQFCSRWTELLHVPVGLDLAGLTDREREVCRWVCEGHRNSAIAELLSISEHTVKQRLKSIFRKLDVGSRAQLQALASARLVDHERDDGQHGGQVKGDGPTGNRRGPGRLIAEPAKSSRVNPV